MIVAHLILQYMIAGSFGKKYCMQTQSFPHNFCVGWAPKPDDRRRPVYARNPILHTVSMFALDSERKMKKSETDYINVGGLNYEGRRFNRQKGVVEYLDQTHAFSHHTNLYYRNAISRDPKVFRHTSNSISQFVDDALSKNEPQPFRVGRYFLSPLHFLQYYHRHEMQTILMGNIYVSWPRSSSLSTRSLIEANSMVTC